MLSRYELQSRQSREQFSWAYFYPSRDSSKSPVLRQIMPPNGQLGSNQRNEGEYDDGRFIPTENYVWEGRFKRHPQLRTTSYLELPYLKEEETSFLNLDMMNHQLWTVGYFLLIHTNIRNLFRFRPVKWLQL